MATSVTSLEGVRGVLGEDFDAVLDRAMRINASGYGDGEGRYPIDFEWGYSYGPLIDLDAMQGWVDECLADRHPRSWPGEAAMGVMEDALDRGASAGEAFPRSLAAFVEQRIMAEPSFDEWYSESLEYVARGVAKDLSEAVGAREPATEVDLASLAESVYDHACGACYANLDVDSALDDDVCVDLLVATPEELDQDLSSAGLAGCLRWDDEWWDSEIGIDRASAAEGVAQTGLAWLCATQGHDVSCLWSRDPTDASPFEETARAEAEDAAHPMASFEVTVCARMSVRHWAAIEGAHAYGIGGSAVTVPRDGGARIGLFDRVGGRSGDLGIVLDRDLTVPMGILDDVQVDSIERNGRGERELVGLRGGCPIHDVMGVTDDLWVRVTEPPEDSVLAHGVSESALAEGVRGERHAGGRSR